MKLNFIFIIPVLLSFRFLFSEMDRSGLFYSQVVQVARESVGMNTIPPEKGKTFTTDCIGFIRYVYCKAGLDLIKAYGKGRGGVSSLYDGLNERGMIYNDRLPLPGDLIFFDNTYDVNRNGKWDDPLSHVAIVEAVGKYNTIYYIDFSNQKVSEERMNLAYPNTHAFRQKDGRYFIINSYLRRNRGEGLERKEYVSSSFFRAFAHVRIQEKPKN